MGSNSTVAQVAANNADAMLRLLRELMLWSQGSSPDAQCFLELAKSVAVVAGHVKHDSDVVQTGGHVRVVVAKL